MVAKLCPKPTGAQDQAQEVFEMLDVDGGGELTREERSGCVLVSNLFLSSLDPMNDVSISQVPDTILVRK